MNAPSRRSEPNRQPHRAEVWARRVAGKRHGHGSHPQTRSRTNLGLLGRGPPAIVGVCRRPNRRIRLLERTLLGGRLVAPIPAGEPLRRHSPAHMELLCATVVQPRGKEASNRSLVEVLPSSRLLAEYRVNCAAPTSASQNSRLLRECRPRQRRRSCTFRRRSSPSPILIAVTKGRQGLGLASENGSRSGVGWRRTSSGAIGQSTNAYGENGDMIDLLCEGHFQADGGA